MPAVVALIVLLMVTGCARSERLVLLISVDTLRADHLGAYGSDRGLTPNLDALAEQSTVFEAAYAPASFTLPSVASMLTGLHPQEAGVLDNYDRLGLDVPTLAETLQRRGFRTGAVVSNFILRIASGIGRGFDVYDDQMTRREVGRGAPERVAGGTTDAALAVLDRLRKNSSGDLLLWVHYQDPHGPYTPPPGYRERELPVELARGDGQLELPARRDDRGAGGIPAYQVIGAHRNAGFYRAGYSGEVRYTDEQIGRLLAGVDQRGLLESAIVVFTADHGEALGEHDYWFAHGENLTDGLVRVPLMWKLPGRAPRLREDVAAAADVLPTLLSLLHASDPPPASGRDLFAEGARDSQSRIFLFGASPLLRRGTVQGRYKLIVTPTQSGWSQVVYERGREAQDLSTSQHAITTRLRRELTQIQQALPARPRLKQDDLSPEDRSHLEALGYAD